MRTRKSVSQTYFIVTTVLLIWSVLLMGIAQFVLSMRYFSSAQRTSLTNVLDIVSAQLAASAEAQRAAQAVEAEVEPSLDQDLLAQISLINSTTRASVVFVADNGKPYRAAGTEAMLTGAWVAQETLDRMDEGGDIFELGRLGGVFSDDYFLVGRNASVTGWQGYVLVCSSSQERTSYVSDTFSAFILSAGFMMIVTSALSIALTVRITQPLQAIGKAAKSFGGGDFSARAPVMGDDEVASLAQTFNRMAVNLETIDKSRSQFMGNIAHELRTPMTSIEGFVDGILDGTIPPELEHHYLEIVSQETARLSRLVQNMLDITKLEAGEYTVNARSYDIWQTITGVVLADEQRITQGAVRLEGLVPEATMVYADPDLVHQVVYNLMDNALKFTPREGTISFRVRRIPGGLVEVSIQNTGEGISQEALPFVFERFYKEDRSRGLNKRGSGLGLHICKVLITLSGGSIHVDSKLGAWCRFWFTLPERPPAELPRHRGARTAKPPEADA